MKRKINKEKLCKIGLVCFVFLLCFSVAVGTEFGSGPDERMKYDVCEYIMENMSLPDGRDETIRSQVWGISYAFSPYLSYIFSGFFMKAVSIFSTSPQVLVVAARMMSVICITIYATFCIKISEKLFANKKYRWLFVFFTTLWPQVIYLGGYINNDSLALMSISIIFYAWLVAREKNWDIKSCILLGTGIGLCALSYYNAYGFLFCSVIFFLINTIQKKFNFKKILSRGAIIAGTAILIAGWFFVRNAIIYNGDFLALRTEEETANMYALPEYKPENRITPKSQGETFSSLITNHDWVQITTKSFIGLFGAMNIAMNKLTYIPYFGLFIFGIFGAAYMFIRKRESAVRKTKNIATLENLEQIDKNERTAIFTTWIIAIVIPIFLSMYYSFASDYQPQGRYIMPILLPLFSLLVLGVENFIEVTIKSNKNKRILLYGLSGIILILPLYFVFFLIIPSI